MTETTTQQPPPTAAVPALHHTVKVMIAEGGFITAEITCTAPDTAACRLDCPTKTCPSWRGTACDCGPLVPAGSCRAVEWLENTGVVDSYGGGTRELHSGPVEVRWRDGYRWAYPATGGAG